VSYTVRPEHIAGVTSHDGLGRKVPAPACRLPVMLEKYAHWGIPVKEIPGGYWTLDVDDDGYTIAIVACPCGDSPQIPAGAGHCCQGDWCRADEQRGVPEPNYEKCPRSYVFTGDSVWVAGSPIERQLQTAAAS
jgi:hypothetical protein